MNQTRESRAAARAATGLANLDEILCGGLPADRLYLIEGDPGAGKTTLGLQFLLEGHKRGEIGLYVSLSETRDELVAVARSHGWSLDGISITELTPNEESLGPDEENTMFHLSDMELAETTKIVMRQVEKLKPRRVIIDSLSEMRLLAQNPLRYRRQILALKQYFIGRHCTVLMLDDLSATHADLQVQSIAHGVISLTGDSPNYGVMRRRLIVRKIRGSTFAAGFHDYVIRRGGLEVFPRLVAAEHPGDFASGTIGSGLPALDAIMGGGIDRGTSTLLLGPAGSGKSTLATQYVDAAARRGEHAAVFMFDESQRTFLGRCAGLGIDIARHVEKGLVTLRPIDPGAVSAGEFVYQVCTEVERNDARIVVIDSLNGFLNAIPDGHFLLLQLHELLTHLGQRGVSTFLIVAQHGMVGTGMQAPVDASYLADSVVLLRYFESCGQVRQALSVLKKRSGAHERTIREFRLGKNGISVGMPLVDFEGVLTGVPAYVGRNSPLLRDETK
jgi:circadian clock protein KaiC